MSTISKFCNQHPKIVTKIKSSTSTCHQHLSHLTQFLMKILVWLNARLQTKLAIKKFTWSIHSRIMNHALRKQYLLCNLHGHPIWFLILDRFDLQLMEPAETPKLKIKMSTVAFIWSQPINKRKNKPKNALVIPKHTVPVKMIPTRQFNCI